MQRLRFTPHFHQAFAHHRVFQAVGAVKIPGVAGTARAAARFMVWQIRTGTRIVSLLGFPGDQTVFDVDFPAAGAGAVYPVGRADDFVMLPTLAISILPGKQRYGCIRSAFSDYGSQRSSSFDNASNGSTSVSVISLEETRCPWLSSTTTDNRQ